MQQFETNPTINKQLQLIKSVDNIDLFTKGETLSEIVNQTRTLVAEFVPDLHTEAGRKKVASFASNISKLKTKIDLVGKELVSEWKSKSKVVDNSRKMVRDELDLLKLEARKPLTDWENIEKERQAKIESALARMNILSRDRDVVTGAKLTLDELNNNFAELGDIDTENLTDDDKQLNELGKCKIYNMNILTGIIHDECELKRQREKLAELEKEKAESDALAREKQIKEDMQANALRALNQAHADAKEKAAQVEIDHVNTCEDARLEAKREFEAKVAQEKLDQERRERSNRHVGKLKREARESLKFTLDVNEPTARAIVEAIHDNLIKNISINY